jgi:transcriptional regulator with XRE-family HTH domain
VSTIGDRIRELREQHNLTQEALAARAGISKGFLSDLENDKRNASAEYALRLAQALGASIDYLLRGEEAPAPVRGPVVIPRELAEFAEQEGLSYSTTIDLLAAHNSVVARRSKSGTPTLTVEEWRRLYEAIRDIFT